MARGSKEFQVERGQNNNGLNPVLLGMSGGKTAVGDLQLIAITGGTSGGVVVASLDTYINNVVSGACNSGGVIYNAIEAAQD